MMTSHIRSLAKKVWHYHLMNHQIVKSDAILVLCSHDKRVAERGAQLFLEGWAPLLIFSAGWEPSLVECGTNRKRISLPRSPLTWVCRKKKFCWKISRPIPARTFCLQRLFSLRETSIRKSSSWCKSLTWNAEVLPLSESCGLRNMCL